MSSSRHHSLRGRQRITAVVLLALAATLPGVRALPSDAADQSRVWGQDRIETAVRIAQTAFPDTADTVYLARADVFADALAAGVLTDGPVLLVPSCGEVPTTVRNEATRLRPAEVIALGGPRAVCDDVLTSVADGRPTDRVAGGSRVETAIAISRRAFPDRATRVYLANLADSPDAVAGGSLTDGPILLTNRSGGVPTAVAEEIARLDPDEVVALGGPVALGDDVLDAAASGRSIRRLAGETRVHTAAAIARHAFPATAPDVFLARGDVFADAVAAGSLTTGPVLLVPSCGALPDVVADTLRAISPRRVIALGGPVALCDDLLSAAAAVVPVVDRPRPDDDVIVPDTTKVLTAAQLAALVAADDTTLRFRLADVPADTFAPGDIIAAAPSDAAPDGLLRRVGRVRTEGDHLLVTTTAADLTAAVHRGELRADVALTPDMVATSTPLPDGVTEVGGRSGRGSARAASGHGWSYDLDHHVLHQGANHEVWVDGHVDISLDFVPEIDLDMVWDIPPVVVDRASFVARVDQSASLDISAHGEADYVQTVTLVSHTFRPITFFVGPVPVVLVPVLTITLTAEGDVEATMTWGAAETLTASAGVEYHRGSGWNPVEDAAIDFDHHEPSLEGEANGTLSTIARMDVKAYGVAGPFVSARLHLRGAAVVEDLCLELDVFGGARLSAGLAARLPSMDDLEEVSFDLVDREDLLQQYDMGCEDPEGYFWFGTIEYDGTYRYSEPGFRRTGDISMSASIPEHTAPDRDINWDDYHVDATGSSVWVASFTGEDACSYRDSASLAGGTASVNQWLDGQNGYEPLVPTIYFRDALVRQTTTCYPPGETEWTESFSSALADAPERPWYDEQAELWRFEGTVTWTEEALDPGGLFTHTTTWSLTSHTGPGLEPISN